MVSHTSWRPNTQHRMMLPMHGTFIPLPDILAFLASLTCLKFNLGALRNLDCAEVTGRTCEVRSSSALRKRLSACEGVGGECTAHLFGEQSLHTIPTNWKALLHNLVQLVVKVGRAESRVSPRPRLVRASCVKSGKAYFWHLGWAQ